jgi:hypothetical protein
MKNNILIELLKEFDPKNPTFRPTEIYNEGWLLRILLNECSKPNYSGELLKFFKGATWFSEAMLPTKFKARSKKELGYKDKLGESRTNADGVIGHIEVGNKGKADLELAKNAKQFVVIEAKINSKLSKGISHSENYDQAARTVACMAETIYSSKKVKLTDIDSLAFIVMAPHRNFEHDSDKKKLCGFWELVSKKSIRNKVETRVSKYEGESEGDYDNWYNQCFTPTLKKIKLDVISWESAIEQLPVGSKERVNQFYQLCLEYN